MHQGAVGGGDDHIFGVLDAGQADARSRIGNGDAQVVALVGAAGTFAGQHADDLEGHVLHQDVTADRVLAVGEELLFDFGADDRDGSTRGHVGFVEKAALGHRPVEDRWKRRAVAADGRGHLAVAVAYLGLQGGRGHDRLDLGQLGQGLHVAQADMAWWRARGGRGAVHEHDVGPEGADLRHHLALATFAHGQHYHHRGHADDDAQQRQGGARAVGPHHPPGGHQGVAGFAEPGAARLVGVGQALAQGVGLQGAGFGCRGRLADGAVTDHRAVAHLDDALCAGSDVAIVGDQDHHVALLRQLVEQGHDLRAAVAVQRTGGLVGEDDVPAVHQRTGNRHSLLLATGQLPRAVAGAFAQPQAPQQHLGACGARGGGGAGVDGRHFDVFLGRGRGDEVVALEHEAEGFTAQPGQLVVIELGHVLASEAVLAGAGPVQAAENVHQGRLAGPRGADDGDEFPGMDAQVDAAQHLHGGAVAAAIGLADAAQLDQRCRHAQLPLPVGPISRRSPSFRPSRI